MTTLKDLIPEEAISTGPSWLGEAIGYATDDSGLTAEQYQQKYHAYLPLARQQRAEGEQAARGFIEGVAAPYYRRRKQNVLKQIPAEDRDFYLKMAAEAAGEPQPERGIAATSAENLARSTKRAGENIKTFVTENIPSMIDAVFSSPVTGRLPGPLDDQIQPNEPPAPTPYDKWVEEQRFIRKAEQIRRAGDPAKGGESRLERAVYGAMEQGPNMALSAAVMLNPATAGPAAIAYWTAQITPDEMDEMRELGIPENRAALFAAASGVGQAIIENSLGKILPAGLIPKATAGLKKSLANRIATGLKEYGKELSEEVLQPMVSISLKETLDQIGQEENFDWRQAVADNAEQFPDTAAIVGVMMGGPAAIQKMADIAESKSTRKTFKDLGVPVDSQQDRTFVKQVADKMAEPATEFAPDAVYTPPVSTATPITPPTTEVAPEEVIPREEEAQAETKAPQAEAVLKQPAKVQARPLKAVKWKLPGEQEQEGQLLGLSADNKNYSDVILDDGSTVSVKTSLLKDAPQAEAVLTPERQPLGAPLQPLGARQKRAKVQANPRIEVSAVPNTGEDLPKLQEVVFDAGAAQHARIVQGVARRGAGGHYDPSSTRTVLRYSGDLDTAAHEIGHILDDQFSIVGQWSGKRQKSPFDAELIPHFSEHGSKTKLLSRRRAEGVAEWIRAWLANPAEAEAAAPSFAKHFYGTVSPESISNLRQFSDQIRKFYGAPAAARTLANVDNTGMDAPSVRERFKGALQEQVPGTFQIDWMDKLQVGTQNSLHSVFKAYDAALQLADLPSVENVPGMQNARDLIRTLAGFNQKWNLLMQQGPWDPKTNQKIQGMGGFDWLLAPIDSTSEAEFDDRMKSVMALLVSQTTSEFAANLDRAAASVVQLTADIQAIRQQRGVAADAEELKEINDAIKQAEKERRRHQQRLGWGGSPDNPKSLAKLPGWVEHRKGRLSGVGGGLESDVAVAKEAAQEIQARPDFPAIQEAANRYRAFSDWALGYMVQTGRMSGQEYARIRESNQQWASLRRVFEENDPAGARRFQSMALGAVGEPVKGRKGSTRLIENPYISLMGQVSSIIKESDRNQALDALVDPLRGKRDIYEGVPINFAQLAARAKEGDANTIPIWHNGVKEYWQFPTDLYNALKNLEGFANDGLVAKVFQLPAKLLRPGVTYSPPFLIRNFARDMLTQPIISSTGRTLRDTLNVFLDYQNASADLARFETAGGGMFGSIMPKQKEYYEMMGQHMRSAGARPDTVLALGRDVLDWYKRMAGSSEYANRVAEFRHAVKQIRQQHPDWSDADVDKRAAYLARDMQDWAVAGTWMRELNKYIPFTNAAVQGIAREYRSVKNDPTGTAKRWLIYVGLMEMGMYLWNWGSGDEDELRQQPAYLQDNFWNFKIPKTDVWLRIPKPWTFGVIGSGIRRAVDAVRGAPNAFEGYAGSFYKSVVPIDETALLGGFRPIIEALVNYDMFRDRNIVPPHEANLDLELRKRTEQASGAARVIQSVVGIDARKIDHVIQGMTGGLGRIAMSLTDLGVKPGAGTKLLNEMSGVLVRSPSLNSRDVQWVMTWAKNKGAESDKRVRQMFELYDAYREAKNSEERVVTSAALRQYATQVRQKIESATAELGHDPVVLQRMLHHLGEFPAVGTKGYRARAKEAAADDAEALKYLRRTGLPNETLLSHYSAYLKGRKFTGETRQRYMRRLRKALATTPAAANSSP